MIGCPLLRLQYLRNIGDPYSISECRIASLKLSGLRKMGEPLPFFHLAQCVMYGDDEVHQHLIRFCDAETVLLAAMENRRTHFIAERCLFELGCTPTWDLEDL